MRIMIQKKRNKPFYKQFLRLRKNIQNRQKLFKFKRQKWLKFQQYSKNQLKIFRRFKIKDQFQLSVSKFASRGNSFQKKFRNNLYERKLFSLFYGGLKSKYLKKHFVKIIVSKNSRDFRHQTLKFFESRLDTVLYRVNFFLSIKSAAQFISHGHVLVNGTSVKTCSHILQTNDLIEIRYNSRSRKLIKKNLEKSNFWPIPPKYLLVNYRTLQVLFLYADSSNLMPIFTNFLNLESIISNIRR